MTTLMSSPIPTLARGLAKRMAREADDDFSDAFRRRLSEGRLPRSRLTWFKRMRSVVIAAFGDLAIGEKRIRDGKKPATCLVGLQPTNDGSGRMQLLEVHIDSKLIHTTRSLACYAYHVYVTKHCIQRLFHRRGLTDTAEAKREFAQVMLQIFKDENIDDGNFEMPTDHGKFVGVFEKGQHITLTTYLRAGMRART